jgi:tRNA(Ile)-lysidine synthase
MAFDSAALSDRLRSLTAGLAVNRWLVAFSGGVDSTVLLHALRQARPDASILAVHIDHALQPESASWECHCRQFAGHLGVEYSSLRIAVDVESAGGVEAAAREARYAALLPLVDDGDCLLSGHHEDDQAETLLLNLLRGSGPAGLAGIGVAQSFGRGYLLRPLLGVSGADIRAYAEHRGLEWIDDPSNVDTRFDRNFLRNEVMPVLMRRWPAAAASLRRSAGLVSESSELLDQLADVDIAAAGQPAQLRLAVVRGLSPARQRNLLKRAIRRCGLPPPPSTRLFQAVEELLPARPDAQPQVAWPGGELRRYRDWLIVMAEPGAPTIEPGTTIQPNADPVELGERLGTIALCTSGGRGIDPAIAAGGLRVALRQGGEEIRLHAGGPSRKLKKLFQEAGILPWMRDRLPLIYAGDRLVGVADLWIAAEVATEPGVVVQWNGRPAIIAGDEID